MQQFHQFAEADRHGRCVQCGLPGYASAHLRYEARPFDHGFATAVGERARFATKSEAEAWARQQHAGRTTSFTGRVASDISYRVIDLADTPLAA